MGNSKLRHKKITLKRRSISTPFFMPDATRGFVKFLSQEDLAKAGAQALVVNTYHLYLHPGIEIIKKAGGIHNFINWPGILLSDSGGFQVFSLIHRNKDMGKIYDDKVIFKSPYDGSKHEFTPEKSIQIQFDLGVDMMVCLDDCPPNSLDKKQIKNSVDRTIYWAKLCKQEYDKQIKARNLDEKSRPLLFSVIQGGEDIELRKYCSEELTKLNFDGYGFGAMPVDSDGKFLDKVLEATASLIPEDKLRFALGIGKIEDIIKCANYGWDMFDCVIPTREGRHGRIIENTNTYNILNSKFQEDFTKLSLDSNFPELNNTSKAFLHHTFKMNDPLAARLASLKNLEEYYKVMQELQK